ncbi:hypothetical protein [Limosilactobacillus reuteri]|uniref:hypothetical protein n=1 Tax=Limosilactobacillus reuteri TaxID=1598 RepID=UPI00128CDBAC|nr:hypothetical protein [Limosilactobacillus reuteri]MQB64640.1 hypothetical protein [Limosilactobacillus reuteri]
MADVKFMNLSENDNPATTDSVLIGNASDGLKRTSLGNIVNLAKIAGPVVHLEYVEGTSNPSATDDTAKRTIPIQAPEVAGYTFAFWLSTATIGGVRPTYVEGPNQSSTKVWIYYAPKEDLTYVDPIKIGLEAVYVKSELM